MNIRTATRTYTNQRSSTARSLTRKLLAGVGVASLLLAAPAMAEEGHGGAHSSGGHSSTGHAAAGVHSGFSGNRGGFAGSRFGAAGTHFGNVGHGYYGAGAYGHGYYGRGFGGYRGAGFYGYRWGYPGFGYFYDSALAWPFLGLAAWDFAYYDQMNEAQARAQQNAIVQATSAPVDQSITWSNGDESGSVTPIRDGRSADGSLCREFQQQITIDGHRQSAYGTACQQPDGSWQVVPNQG